MNDLSDPPFASASIAIAGRLCKHLQSNDASVVVYAKKRVEWQVVLSIAIAIQQQLLN